MKARWGFMASILMAACATAPRESLDEQVRLAYAGQPGDVFGYSAEQTLRGRISMQGMPQLVAVKTRADVSRSVIEMLPDGRRRVAMKYGIAFLEVNGAELEIEESWRGLGAEFLQAPSGVIEESEEIQEPRETFELIVRGLETFFPVFPEEPVNPGDRWKRSFTEGTEAGRMKTEISVRYAGIEEVEGTACAVLEIEGVARSPGLSGAGNGGAVELDFSGVSYFDVSSGCLLRARQRGRIRIMAKTQELAMNVDLNFIARIRLLTAP